MYNENHVQQFKYGKGFQKCHQITWPHPKNQSWDIIQLVWPHIFHLHPPLDHLCWSVQAVPCNGKTIPARSQNENNMQFYMEPVECLRQET